MDWGHSMIGQLLGSEYQVIYFFSALTWGIFLTVHLFSIPEQPLDKNISDPSPPSALRLLGSHNNGYGALAKEPSSPVVPVSVPDLRPRSFSALGEANSVTSSAKQPNKEVCDVQDNQSLWMQLFYCVYIVLYTHFVTSILFIYLFIHFIKPLILLMLKRKWTHNIV